MRWRRLRTLLVREGRATLRDPFTITILVAVPLVALLAFGFVLSTEVKGLPLAVLDASDTPASRRLIADLAAQGTFVPRRVVTRAALERALVGGAVSAALVVPPDFDRARARGADRPQVQLVYDGAEAVLAGNAEGYLQALVEAAGATLARPGAPRAGDGVTVAERALFNPTLDGKPFMVAGTFGFVLSFLTILITAVSIVNERLGGTFEQLQVTPATSVEILLGKVLPMGAIFTLDVVLMVVVAGVVLGVWPQGSVLLFVGVSAYYVSISLAAGLLISATSETANEAVQKTVLVSVPLVQLSGFIFPIRSMPIPFQWATTLFPATHYIAVTRGIYLRAEGLTTLWPELLALLGFGVVLIGLALRTMGRRP
ncbi:MAG TPA: ABC transporter permease [Candidatus Binatia bacterium]|nr:ABC transporter permease [Candidatus Binatia bacterium]